jgi:hypothetical protein
MKHANPSLVILWSAAILAMGIGIISAIQSLSGLNRQNDLWKQKRSDRQELHRLLDRSRNFTRAVNAHKAWPSSPPPLQDMITATLPGVTPSPLSFSDQPSLKHWTTRRVSFSLTDVQGESLGNFLDAAATSRPPWSVEEITLTASPSSGRLARVDMIMVAVERAASDD